MKKLFYIAGIVWAMSACSDGKEDIPKEPEKPQEIVKIKISTPDNGINIFELMRFDVKVENDNPGHLGFGMGLTQVYDSIVWSIPDLKSRFKCFEYEPGSMHFTYQWGHNFFVPGQFETHLSGYKNNEIIYSDTLEVKVVDDKDFLGYNWADITTPSQANTGYADVLNEDVQFVTRREIHDGMPSVQLFLWHRDPDSAESIRKSEKILSDYISALYSEPAYTAENGITEKYDELFHFREEGTEPRNIWITNKSKIVLLACSDYPDFRIYAEPNR